MNWTQEFAHYWQGPNGFKIATRPFKWNSGKHDAFVLYNGFRELGTYQTLEEAQEAAEPQEEVRS